MPGREGHVGQHVDRALLDQGRKLRPARAELIGDVPPDVHNTFQIGLIERLPDRGRDPAGV